MQPATVLFEEYGSYHRDPRNRLCHEIGIPLIVLAIEALLRMADGAGLVALGLTLVVAAYYVAIARTAAIPAIAGLVALWFLAGYVTWPWAIAAFVAGWIFQFVGHAYEGKKPAFLTNFVHLLVGPLWIGHILTSPRRS